MVDIRRGFAAVAEGQVHYREAGRRRGGARPVVALHASPGSAKMLEPLLSDLGRDRYVVAPDTLGNGDSSPPKVDDANSYPPLSYFAAAHLRALDDLGIEDFDLYGTHTGANIAIEMALMMPHRVNRMILDGVSLYADDERDDLLRNYAPGVRLEADGAHLWRLWSFVRDALVFWPWYRHGPENCRRIGLPDAGALHDKAVEVFKAARTYHVSYNSALAYDKTERLPLVEVPTLLACAEQDMLFEYFDAVCSLLPSATRFVTPEATSQGQAERHTAFLEFFGAGR